MDTEGRVLRFDSFSKILSSGMRVGFATGPKPLIERIVLHMQVLRKKSTLFLWHFVDCVSCFLEFQVSTVQANSLSQVLVVELLKAWGEEGFFQHVDKVKEFYQHRRDVMVAAADKHLKGGWHTWARGGVRGGMPIG